MADGAVTFDFHNTLVRCEPWFDLEIRHLVSAYLRWEGEQTGRPPTAAELLAADDGYRRLRQEIVASGIEQQAEACVASVLAELGRAVDASMVANGVERLMEGTLAAMEGAPGAAVTVRTLAEAGVRLGVVSSAVYHPFLLWSLDRLGIQGCFADITTSASAGYYKSRPEIYWHAAERLGVPAAAVVHVGDSFRWDIDGARAAGCRAVWISNGERAAPGAEPALTLPSLVGAADPLLDLLRQAG